MVYANINTFLSKSIKKNRRPYKAVRQLYIDKDGLVSVKYGLNQTKVEN